VELDRQARSRRPPGYLADYHVGPVDVPPLENNSPGTGIYSHPHVLGYLESEGSSSDEIEFTYRRSADTDYAELPNLNSSWNMTGHVTARLARKNFTARGSVFQLQSQYRPHILS